MTAELTSEEIVTKLLTSNEILKPNQKNFYISDYKTNSPENFLIESPLKKKIPDIRTIGNSKYIFIK